jgi:DNA-directed RNA polymerase specialized sigma24 family protein
VPIRNTHCLDHDRIKKLLDDVARGSENALSDLYDLLSQESYALCCAECGPEAADQAMLRAWIRIWRYAPSLAASGEDPTDAILATVLARSPLHRQ